jgi:hypothetical protein
MGEQDNEMRSKQMTTDREPLTIRKLAAYWNKPVEELLDMEISVGVRDGHLNFDSYALSMNYPSVNLQHSGLNHERHHLRFDALLSNHRLVKIKKDAA